MIIIINPTRREVNTLLLLPLSLLPRYVRFARNDAFLRETWAVLLRVLDERARAEKKLRGRRPRTRKNAALR